ncbi:MAG: chemotaxis protein CheW [Magnetococcales bacterium]|nr:chemotaxis protein CheW [Magnetococcales bacterium]
MAARFPIDIEYLVFTVNQGRYGIPCSDVVSVMDMPACTTVPHMPADTRGVIPFRESNIPLVDLRICFGAQARMEETEALVTTMGLRKQDHVNWLNKLKDEVYNDKPITVQTDHHKCAFGKWFDQFQSDNINLAAYVHRFDKPHQEIHRVAIEANELIRNDQSKQARELIQRTETGVLLRLIELFDGVAEQVRKYLLEYAIILQAGGELFAVAVDDINFFSRLTHIEHPLPAGSATHDSGFVQALGRYREDEEGSVVEKDVLLLDMSMISLQAV